MMFHYSDKDGREYIMEPATHIAFQRKCQKIESPLETFHPLPGLYEYYHLDRLIGITVDLAHKRNREYTGLTAPQKPSSKSKIARFLAVKMRDYQCDTGITVREFV